MRFLIDVQLPPALCVWLRARGHEAEHVLDALSETASDPAIAAYARGKGQIVVSKDEDSVPLVGALRFQLVWLRCGNSTKRRLLIWLETHWNSGLSAVNS